MLCFETLAQLRLSPSEGTEILMKHQTPQQGTCRCGTTATRGRCPRDAAAADTVRPASSGGGRLPSWAHCLLRWRAKAARRARRGEGAGDVGVGCHHWMPLLARAEMRAVGGLPAAAAAAAIRLSSLSGCLPGWYRVLALRHCGPHPARPAASQQQSTHSPRRGFTAVVRLKRLNFYGNEFGFNDSLKLRIVPRKFQTARRTYHPKVT